MRDRKVSEGPPHWGPGVRSQGCTLGAIGSHGEFVSTEQSCAPGEKFCDSEADWEKRSWGPWNNSGGLCKVQGRDERVDQGQRRQKSLKGSYLTGGYWSMMGPGKGNKGQRKAEQGPRESLPQLPCLLGIRYLLTHLEPLVHPKHTPAKKVTMETSGFQKPPRPADPLARYSFAETVPKVGLTSSSLVREKGRSPRGAWVGKAGSGGGDPASLSEDLPGFTQMAENSINRI